MGDAAKKPEIVQPGEPQAPPDPATAVTAAYSVQTITQFNTAIPSHVWTSEVLKDLHEKQFEISKRNIKSLDDQRVREHNGGIAAFGVITAILLFGCYLVLQNNPIGKDILLGTLTFLAGYLAGYGTGKTQPRS